jgi:ABC-type hemin transport system ATPase subunit
LLQALCTASASTIVRAAPSRISSQAVWRGVLSWRLRPSARPTSSSSTSRQQALIPENVATVMAYLRAWADAGKAVVLITHDLAAVLPVADRITVLREGVSIETAPARAFAGKGLALKTAYARALWLALPQNDFSGGKARLAA